MDNMADLDFRNKNVALLPVISLSLSSDHQTFTHLQWISIGCNVASELLLAMSLSVAPSSQASHMLNWTSVTVSRFHGNEVIWVVAYKHFSPLTDNHAC